MPRQQARIGLPRPGRWREVLNTDAAFYGGTNGGNLGGVEAVAVPASGLLCSAEIGLPPPGTIFPLPEAWCR